MPKFKIIFFNEQKPCGLREIGKKLRQAFHARYVRKPTVVFGPTFSKRNTKK